MLLQNVPSTVGASNHPPVAAPGSRLPTMSKSAATQKTSEADLSLQERMGAACVGSALVAITMTPLDVAKIRLQAAETSLRHEAKGHVCNPRCRDFLVHDGIGEIRELKSSWPRWFPPRNPSYPSMSSVLRTTLLEDGVRGLYAGFVPTLIMSVPNNVLYFAAYETFRDEMRSHGYGDIASPLAGGSAARMLATAVTAPLEYIRTRRQAGKSFAEIRTAVAATGQLSLWRGVVPTLWRDVPFSALYWGIYESAKSELLAHSTLSNNVAAFVSGGLAGSVAAAATMPFDVVKTRAQVEASCGAETQPSLREFLATIVRTEGAPALFRGMTPRILRAGPSCAIMIATYEKVKEILIVGGA
eukprot:Rhum_TRINITY_DN14777_c0_g1::Rhum_TRINITY_DN14777_c0_g1_i1::g.115935::m.115935/K15119/SLC25A39_40; solute carrier family 25, member 39/40